MLLAVHARSPPVPACVETVRTFTFTVRQLARNPEQTHYLSFPYLLSASGGTRTPNLLIRSQVLLSVELRTQVLPLAYIFLRRALTPDTAPHLPVSPCRYFLVIMFPVLTFRAFCHVGDAGIEPAASTVSGWRSPAELNALGAAVIALALRGGTTSRLPWLGRLRRLACSARSLPDLNRRPPP